MGMIWIANLIPPKSSKVIIVKSGLRMAEIEIAANCKCTNKKIHYQYLACLAKNLRLYQDLSF